MRYEFECCCLTWGEGVSLLLGPHVPNPGHQQRAIATNLGNGELLCVWVGIWKNPTILSPFAELRLLLLTFFSKRP